jgi:protein phosphatase
VRPSNEDQFLIADLGTTMRVSQTSVPDRQLLQGPASDPLGDARGNLFLVADGMGGHRAGERASELAVLAIEQFTLDTVKGLFDHDGADAPRVLAQFQAAVEAADARIAEEAAEHPALQGMGTTLTIAYQLDTQLCVVHAGDSRAYVYRNDVLHQLTQDHTMVADMVRAGTLQPEDAAVHRMRHVVTNVVGGPAEGVFVEAHAVELQAGDRLLLCSDGLTEMLCNDAIAEVLRNTLEPSAACQQLLDKANAAGGSDNITIVIVRFDPTDTV